MDFKYWGIIKVLKTYILKFSTGKIKSIFCIYRFENILVAVILPKILDALCIYV